MVIVAGLNLLKSESMVLTLQSTKEIKMEVKDPSKKHFMVSMIKSMFRLAAGAALVLGLFVTSGSLFIIAEVLGIVEEL